VEEAEPPPRYIAISDRVEFEVGKAVLLRESLAILDQVVDVMLKNQDIEVVEVEGHTDSTGEIEDNQILSEERAAAVREYLVSRGVAEFRLTARGYGESVPLSTNDSDGGRQTNRRVQFRIIRQTGKP
jgi:OOP family OmpA-OmpF porin